MTLAGAVVVVPPAHAAAADPELTAHVGREANSAGWYRKAPKHRVGELQNITQFFHPLDLVGEWNRVYGPNGFLQYQFMVPFGQEAMFRRSIDKISASGHVSFLNVLKTFGEHMFNRYVEIKRQEWEEYRVQVTQWGLDRYLAVL